VHAMCKLCEDAVHILEHGAKKHLFPACLEHRQLQGKHGGEAGDRLGDKFWLHAAKWPRSKFATQVSQHGKRSCCSTFPEVTGLVSSNLPLW
jgi:hypothetical protein